MNKIMEKLKIPGYETREIIVPIQGESNKKLIGTQLSLDLNIVSQNLSKKKKV